ncbi:MAG: ATP-binding cassette domain-containing protein [Deltaproteobacteria bacterium]|nr:ATP-binding cassette domain-containing protein [Deltaproteobacteria bacterium]
MARVELEHIDKVYPNGARAVVDCSLRVEDAELLVLVGPSGCGKSTVLRLVAGLEEVSAGTLRIGDRVANQLPPQARNVAMVFQDYALYPQMTVRRNLEFPLRMRGLGRAELGAKVERIAGLLDLAPLLDRLPRQLSGGQRQRVAMGRALVREPAVSLLDEPLSNLDAKLRVQVRAEIGELQERTKTTMIYVTHDQVEAMTLGHRVAVMDKGRLQQVSTPRDLYDAPANAFVAGFIGNPPMNLFAARLGVDEYGGAALTLGAQTITISAERLAKVKGAARDRVLTAGIRPEHLRLADAKTGAEARRDTPALDAVVEHVEWLGHETLAYVRVPDDTPAAERDAAGAHQLVARLPGMQMLSTGDAVRLALDPAHLYFFDADGRALPG